MSEYRAEADAIIEAAQAPLKVITLADNREVALLPAGFTPHILSLNKPVPDHIRARRSLHDGDSFARYVSRFKDSSSLMLADVSRGLVTALLDYHTEEAVNHAEHVALWPIPFSEEFKAWSNFIGKGQLHDQATFLRFIEENVDDIKRPDPARMLELAADFAVEKNVKFQSSKRLQNGDRALTYVQESSAKGAVEIPQKVTFSMPIYFGEEVQEFDAFFRYRINEGVLHLGFEFHRIEPIKQAAFRAAVARVAEAAGIDPFYGDGGV